MLDDEHPMPEVISIEDRGQQRSKLLNGKGLAHTLKSGRSYCIDRKAISTLNY